MTKPAIDIEVVSDVVCPWCYIGKRRMEKAIDQLKDQFDFNIHFSPFELNPGVPSEGLDQKEYLSDKFGGDDRYQQVTERVTRVAETEGLKFDFSKQGITPNTRDAHRVIRHAKSKGVQAAVKEAFMKAYFEEGIDLSKKENIISIAAAAGLDEQEVTLMLASEAGIREVNDAEQLSIQRGVNGVPFYIINGKYGFSGAQPTEVFVNAIQEIGALAKPGVEEK